MQTIEFETKIVDGIIKIPQKYKNLYNTDAKVAIFVENEAIKNKEIGLNNSSNHIDLEKSSVSILDFSKYNIACFKNINPIEYQRKLRDAK